MNGTCTQLNLMTVWKWETRIQESNFSESIGLMGKVNLSEGSSVLDLQVKHQSSGDGSNQTYSTCHCLLLSSEAHGSTCCRCKHPANSHPKYRGYFAWYQLLKYGCRPVFSFLVTLLYCYSILYQQM